METAILVRSNVPEFETNGNDVPDFRAHDKNVTPEEVLCFVGSYDTL